jgi:hypothetical protein
LRSISSKGKGFFIHTFFFLGLYEIYFILFFRKLKYYRAFNIDVNTHMSTSKAKSLAVFVPVGAVLVFSAMLATPWLAAPAYADSHDGYCDPKYDPKCPPPKDDKCDPKYDPKCEPKKDNKKKYPVCHNGKQIYVGSYNAQQKHLDKPLRRQEILPEERLLMTNMIRNLTVVRFLDCLA